MTLVNNLFDGKGFQGLKRSTLIALSAKNKLGFINGFTPIPPTNSSNIPLCHRSNDMVTSWLLNSIKRYCEKCNLLKDCKGIVEQLGAQVWSNQWC
uniref:Retrotransposon Copia-like N-terminal domain-containing protein n=1 Tax=Solanum tuberosum TaxID=4113 RepID=M1BZE1_SOLTU